MMFRAAAVFAALLIPCGFAAFAGELNYNPLTETPGGPPPMASIDRPASLPGLGIGTRGRPLPGYRENGPIGLPWADARIANELPRCGEAAVLDTITDEFGEKEARFWRSSLAITGFDALRHRTVGHGTWPANALPRRGCTARAVFSDGKARGVSYTITAAHGVAGYGWGVTWCVQGLDRGWAFQPGCKLALP